MGRTPEQVFDVETVASEPWLRRQERLQLLSAYLVNAPCYRKEAFVNA